MANAIVDGAFFIHIGFSKEFGSTTDNIEKRYLLKLCLKYVAYLNKLISSKNIQLIEEKEKPGYLIDAIRKRIKYLEANDPGNVTPEQLKLQTLINVSEEE